MPHSGGGGSSGGGSHGGSRGHGGSSGSSRRHAYFPGSYHHRYVYRGKQVSYYSREPVPRTKPKFPVVQIVFSLIFGSMFMLGWLFSLLVAIVPTSPRLPKQLKYQTEYIDELAGNTRLSAAEVANVETALLTFAEETNIPVCFEVVSYENWNGYYASLEKYAYQSYVTKWSDEDHFLIVLSFNPGGIVENDLNYVNLWRFETMVGDNLSCLSTKQCNVFNDAFTEKLYNLSSEYTVDMALNEALDKLNTSLHTKQGGGFAGVFATLFMLPALVPFGILLFYSPIKSYRERVAEYEYYQKNGFPETREELLARYTKAMNVLRECPNCGAPNKENREICEYCNSNLLKKDVNKQSGKMARR